MELVHIYYYFDSNHTNVIKLNSVIYSWWSCANRTVDTLDGAVEDWFERVDIVSVSETSICCSRTSLLDVLLATKLSA